MKTHRSIIQSFSQTRVLVIGDLIFDVYHEGTPLGISAETPTLVVKHKNSAITLGGAGCLVRHMLELGGNVVFITSAGGDDFSHYAKQFTHKNLKKIFFYERGRISTVKERFWSGGYKLLSWDRFDNRPVSPALERKIKNAAAKNIKTCDKIIVSDYRHGLLTKHLASALVTMAKLHKKPLYLDSQVSQSGGNHLWYKGADVVCLNAREAASIDTHYQPATLASLKRLQEIMDARAIVVKCGKDGSESIIADTYLRTPALSLDAKDTTGAGDAFFAALALARRITADELAIANAWAGLSTAIIGTIPPKKDELLRIL